MRIGIDANPFLDAHMTGVPLYVDALLREYLAAEASSDQFVLVAQKPVPALRALLQRHGVVWRDDPALEFASDAFEARVAPRFPRLGQPPWDWVTRKLDGRVLVPVNIAVNRYHVGPLDLFHHAGAPVPTRRARRHVVTVHDLTARLFPQTHRPEVVAGFDALCAFVRKKADFVIAVSEATRRDVIEHLQIPEERVRTILEAARTSLPRDLAPETIRAVCSRLGIAERRYILAGGSVEPRKNLPRLIEAFAALISESKAANDDLVLVLAGARQHGAEAVEAAVARYGLAGKVMATGYISDQEMAALMIGCAVFAYVSLYEGFGLPLLEAMALGAPVVTSNVSSMPEVAGDPPAAVLVDPLSVESIADGLRRVLTDTSFAAALREKGRARAKQFSWKKAAAEHRKIYHEVAAT